MRAMPPAPTTAPHSLERKCAFCLQEDADNEHRDECLRKHDSEVIHRSDRDLARDGLVRIRTCGEKLGPRTLDIPLKKLRATVGAFEQEIWWRIRHCFHERPGRGEWDLRAYRATGNMLADCNGKLLSAGEVVDVMVDGDTKEDGDAQSTDVILNATPDVDVLGATDHYESRKNRVGYIISEFVDNSLMALSNTAWVRTPPRLRAFRVAPLTSYRRPLHRPQCASMSTRDGQEIMYRPSASRCS